MLKRMKIVTSLLLVLALFGLLQLASGGLFFNSLKNDKENFTVLQTIRQQQSALNATWVELRKKTGRFTSRSRAIRAKAKPLSRRSIAPMTSITVRWRS